MLVTYTANLANMMEQFESLRTREGIQMMLAEFARDIRLMVVNRTPYDNFSKAGKAKADKDHIKFSWDIAFNETKRGTFQASIFTDSKYAEVLEEGKYRGIGPRTDTGASGGIYSKQAVGGMVQPVIDDEDAIAKIFEESAKSIEQIWNLGYD